MSLRRTIVKWAIITCVIVGGLFVLYLPMTELSGVNFIMRQRTVPLYHKALGFLHRDAEYRYLARTITRKAPDPKERLKRIYQWSVTHFPLEAPAGLPVYDDHIWYVIVRGYGEEDQVAEVFAILCAYAGIETGLVRLTPDGHLEDGPFITLVAVKLEGQWRVIDPARRIILQDEQGELVALLDLADLTLWRDRLPAIEVHGRPYASYLEAIDEATQPNQSRLTLQVPWLRLGIELQRVWQRLIYRGEGS